MKKVFIFLLAITMYNSLIAQIPNSGFETWDTVGSYIIPAGWDNLDSITSSLSVFTCERGTPGYVGSSFLKLTSRTAGISVAPGIAVSGKIDFTTTPPTPKSGFPFTVRPSNLTGAWQFMGFGTDQGHIMILLTKWDSSLSKRDTVAFTNSGLAGMVMIWGTFSIPITYFSGSYPDSAMILLSSSGATPVANSYLWVDNLAFTGTVPSNVTAISRTSEFSSIIPNPANSNTIIYYTSSSEETLKVNISDITGKSIYSLTPKVVIGENKIHLNVSEFPKGTYFISIAGENNTQRHRLVIE